MTKGKLKKHILKMRDDWKKRRFELSLEGMINPDLQPEDVFPILDEAANIFPKRPNRANVYEGDKNSQDCQDWFKKWFGEQK